MFPKVKTPDTTDDWIKESIKRIFSSGLFWTVRAAEKKSPNCHNYATFEASFLKLLWSKNNFIFLKNTQRPHLKVANCKVMKSIKKIIE